MLVTIGEFGCLIATIKMSNGNVLTTSVKAGNDETLALELYKYKNK